VDEDANLIFGAVVNDELEDVLSITIIATGFPDEEEIDPLSSGSSRHAASFSRGGSSGAGRQAGADAVGAAPARQAPAQQARNTPEPPRPRTSSQGLDIPDFLRKKKGPW
jgi:cell division GTPase FtsZ